MPLARPDWPLWDVAKFFNKLNSEFYSSIYILPVRLAYVGTSIHVNVSIVGIAGGFPIGKKFNADKT